MQSVKPCPTKFNTLQGRVSRNFGSFSNNVFAYSRSSTWQLTGEYTSQSNSRIAWFAQGMIFSGLANLAATAASFIEEEGVISYATAPSNRCLAFGSCFKCMPGTGSIPSSKSCSMFCFNCRSMHFLTLNRHLPVHQWENCWQSINRWKPEVSHGNLQSTVLQKELHLPNSRVHSRIPFWLCCCVSQNLFSMTSVRKHILSQSQQTWHRKLAIRIYGELKVYSPKNTSFLSFVYYPCPYFSHYSTPNCCETLCTYLSNLVINQLSHMIINSC